MKKAVIILPTYNEEGSISSIIPQIFEQQKKTVIWELHVLVVDSYSSDKTAEMVRSLQKKYHNLHLIETKKEGLGKAYLNGFAFALEKLNAFVVMEMDADLSHDPNDVPRFLKKVEEGADFVIGSRYMNGGSIPSDWGFHRKLFSILGNLVIRVGFMRLKNTEWTNGFRAIKSWIIKDAYDHIKNYSGYVFQVAFLDYAITHQAKVVEIPTHFKDRKTGYSKINAIQYIVNSLLYVFFNSSFIKFAIVGFIGFGVDFGISYLGIDVFKKPVWIATLISTETAIISNFILNNFWAFAHKKLEHNPLSYLLSFIKFNLISSGSILIQTIGVQLLVNFAGKQYWPLYKITIITFVIIPYSYILYNKFIWKEKK